MHILTFKDIVEFVDNFSWPPVEGSIAVDNIIILGIIKSDINTTCFFALSMSLTNPKKKPYEANMLVFVKTRHYQFLFLDRKRTKPL